MNVYFIKMNLRVVNEDVMSWLAKNPNYQVYGPHESGTKEQEHYY